MKSPTLRTYRHLSFWMLCCALLLSGNPKTSIEPKDFPFAPVTLNQADSLISKLSDREKIAQLFILREVERADLTPAGYLLNSEGTHEVSPPAKYGLPQYIGLDLVHSSDPRGGFSEELLAAVNDPQLLFDYAQAFAKNLQSEGINFVLGPSLDIHYNDFNPLTEMHSFSDTSTVVVEQAKVYIEGLRAGGVMAVAGSYPGIGNMDRGYAKSPPTVYSRDKQLYGEDMVPFKALVNEGLQSVLMSSAFVPAIDSGDNVSASTSLKVHSTLRDQMGFEGLVWADLSNSNQYRSKSEPIIQALLAGSDIIVTSRDIESSVDEVEQSIELGLITMEEIEARVKRVIQSKLWSKSLSSQLPSDLKKQTEKELELKSRKVISSSLTLLKNNDDLIPLKNLDTLKTALVHIGYEQDENLAHLLHRYAPGSVFHIDIDKLEEGYSKLEKIQEQFNLVIIIANPEKDLNRKRFGMGEHYQSVIERIGYAQRTALIWNGKPKALLLVSNIPSISSIIASYESSAWTNDYAIQAVFGGRSMTGSTKRKLGNEYARHTGIQTAKTRLGYGIPEEVGIRSEDLVRIDEIVDSAIREKACPGAQVWFAKDGIVVVDRAYGYHTYQEDDKVKHSDLYDIASITKIAGSVGGLMALTQDSLFNLDFSLCDYLPEWVDTTDYMQLGMREIFAHQAGLPAFIPFYSKTIKKGVPRYDVYSLAQSNIYPLTVARELYINGDLPDQMFQQIITHPLKSERKYLYSDVGYYFALRIIEKQSGMKMEDYLDRKIYSPMGMATMTYRPLEKVDKSRITPTEYDRYFRNQLVHGYVHDPGAAMLGGVGGHAGLFSNANDLGKLMQMYLNGGDYGSHHYFDSTVIADFIRCQFCDNDNRRGAGFDKPLRDGKSGPSCGCTDIEAFGHQGFTGTTTWADPRDQVVYVFLSNRVYPNAENRKLAEMNVRTNVQKVFHQAIRTSEELAEGRQGK